MHEVALAAVTLDGATLAAVLAALVAAGSSLFRWRSGERGNVLAQTSAEIAAAAGVTVQNLQDDNRRLRAENADLLARLDEWEARVARLTTEINGLRTELAQARESHTRRHQAPQT